jgi:membrane protease subunit HflK
MDNESKNNKDLRAAEGKNSAIEALDTAGKSLSDALKLSFVILKIIMAVLIIAFLASGFETVASDEQALVMRFGKIRGVGEQRLLGPGAHWILPYPIDEIIKIPVETKVNLAVDSFWYFQTDQEKLSGQERPVNPGQALDPLLDGYCITRSGMQAAAAAASGADGSIGRAQPAAARTGQAAIGTDGSDYNIVHTKWQLTYQIFDPEKFFRNIYVRDAKPGDVYFSVIKESVSPLLKSIFEDSVVKSMVIYTIDDAISSQDRIPRHVGALLQGKLDEIESGIKVVSVQLTSSTCPRQVKEAFEASTKASQTSETAITQARTEAEKILNEAAGAVARQLFNALHDEKVSEERREDLWSQLAGTAKGKISQAQAYRTNIVESAKADAAYIESLLPEYRKRPQLVVQQIYLDALEKIFGNADEKFIIQPTEGAKNVEIRIQLNQDQTLKPKASGIKTTEK